MRITKILLLCLFFISLSSNLVFPHSGKIKGKIIDVKSLESIPFVNILLLPLGKGTSSDENGKFNLDKIPEGTYELKFTHLGYQTLQMEVIIVADDELNLTIELVKTYFNLADVIILSNASPSETFQVINKIDSELRPINTSQDVLRIIPGVVTAQHGGGGKAEQIFLRGFDNDHGTDIAVSFDGIPVNMVSHAHGQGYADLHFIIPETIGVVDFGKGPYYSEHGNFNTAGYADFRSLNNLEKNKIKIEGGQFNTIRTVAMANVISNRIENQNAYVAAEYFYSDGYFDLPQNFNRINLFGKYAGRISDNLFMTISASTFSSKWDQSGQIPKRVVDNKLIDRFGAIDLTEGGSTSRSNLNLIFRTTLNANSLLKNQFYYSNYGFNLFSNFTFFYNDTANGDQIYQTENREIFGYRSSLSYASTIFGRALNSTAGISLRYDKIRDLSLFNTLDRKVFLDTLALGDVDETNIAIYYDANLSISDKLSLHLGLRYDHFIFDYIDNATNEYINLSDDHGILSPKLSLNYNWNNDVQVYIKSGMGFHSNDTRSVVIGYVFDKLPTAIGADLGVFLNPMGNILLNISTWMLYLESEFVYVGDEAIVEPSDETMRLGIDFSIRYQVTNNLFFDFDYNYSHGRFINEPKSANRIPLAPTHTSIGGITFKPLTGLGGSLRYRFISERPANEDNSIQALGSFILDAFLFYRIDNCEFFAKMENLTNAEWNEAQFDTESRIRYPDSQGRFLGVLESTSISELHYTPGTPFWLKIGMIVSL